MKNKTVVVMPVAFRPELLALALECLGKTRYCPDVHVYVDYIDDDPPRERIKAEFKHVFQKYGFAGCNLHFREQHPRVSSGCWNILESIRNGYHTGAEYITLIEEDVFVRPEIFERHWELLQSGDYLASCGRRCRRFYALCPDIYTNPGSMLERRLVQNLLPHVCDEFYANTGGYMDRVIGTPAGINGLDDGLIRRVIWQMNGGKSDRVVYSVDPLCSHVGIHAFENRYSFVGVDWDAPVDERIKGLRKFFATEDPVNGKNSRYLGDFDPLTEDQKLSFASKL